MPIKKGILIPVGNSRLWIHSIDLQSRYEIYAVIEAVDNIYWDTSALFPAVTISFYSYIFGTYFIIYIYIYIYKPAHLTGG